MERIKFIDLFCGIGGFRVAMEEACRDNDIIPDCVFSSDIDKYCQDSYENNFGERPFGDIVEKVCLFSHGGAIHDTIASVERHCR